MSGLIVGAAVAVPALGLIAAHERPRVLVMAVVGASAGVQNAQIANVHVFTILALSLLLILGPRPTALQQKRAAVVVGAVSCYAVTALFGDLVSNPLLGGQFLLLSLSAAVLLLVVRDEDALPFLTGLLATITASSLFALGQYVGIVPHNFFLAGRPSGFYAEPDWLGMYAACGLILALRSQSRFRFILVVINASAVLLAAARAAWLAVILVGLFVGLINLMRRSAGRAAHRPGALRALIGCLAILAVLLVVNEPLRDRLETRMAGAVLSQADVSARARLQQVEGLLYLATYDLPWYGHGVSASGRVGVSGRLEFGSPDNSVASNWILALYVDSALLAIPLILLFVGGALRRPRATANMLLMAILASSIFSNALLFPVTWAALAFALRPCVETEAALPDGIPCSVGRGSDEARQFN